MVNRYERFTGLISEIHRHLIKISSDEMKKYGLHGTSARILLAFQTCGSMTAAELTKAVGKNKAEVSRTVANLEENGLIERSAGSANYRVRLRLTEAGSAIAEGLYQTVKDTVSFVGQDLTQEEREILYRALNSISDNLATVAKSAK